MKRLSPIILVAFLIGCAQLQPGSDPVVVDAERTTAVALATMDTLLQIEWNNKALLLKVNPAVHTYAEYIRLNGQHYLLTARALTLAYKNNRSASNQANLSSAIALLNSIDAQAQTYINQAKAVAPTPTPIPTP
jgi:predicted outer membrane protein